MWTEEHIYKTLWGCNEQNPDCGKLTGQTIQPIQQISQGEDRRGGEGEDRRKKEGEPIVNLLTYFFKPEKFGVTNTLFCHCTLKLSLTEMFAVRMLLKA